MTWNYKDKPNANNTKEQYGQSGKTTINSYYFKGNTLSLAKQMASYYKNILDWNNNPTLQAETFAQQFSCDSFPTSKVVFAGSSVLDILQGSADLSRNSLDDYFAYIEKAGKSFGVKDDIEYGYLNVIPLWIKLLKISI